jgi:hypothetical protein
LYFFFNSLFYKKKNNLTYPCSFINWKIAMGLFVPVWARSSQIREEGRRPLAIEGEDPFRGKALYREYILRCIPE